jgi:hypothetical protein
MDTWPVNQRVFAVTTFIECKSIITVQRNFRRQFNIPVGGNVPSRNSILDWYYKFQNTGSVLTTYKGSQKSVRTPENIERVRQAIDQSPQRSTRRHSQSLNLSTRTVRRILHNDLQLFPYKVQIVQQLLPNDFGTRIKFCNRFQQLLHENHEFMSNLLMSDEAHFHLCGVVNKQNYRFWASEKPSFLHKTPLRSAKVTVWCGVTSFGILGPYFFEENNV